MKKKGKKKEANQYDKIVKENVEAVFIPILLARYGKNAQSCEILPSDFQTTEERELDLLLKIIDEFGYTFLLHAEFQTRADKKMVFRFSEYHGLLVKKLELQVIHVVIELEEEYTEIETFLPEIFHFTSFECIHIHQLKATDLLESTVIGEIILTILADFEGIAPEIVIQQIINKLQTVSTNDAELKKYINQLNVFARLRGLQDFT